MDQMENRCYQKISSIANGEPYRGGNQIVRILEIIFHVRHNTLFHGNPKLQTLVFCTPTFFHRAEADNLILTNEKSGPALKTASF